MWLIAKLPCVQPKHTIYLFGLGFNCLAMALYVVFTYVIYDEDNHVPISTNGTVRDELRADMAYDNLIHVVRNDKLFNTAVIDNTAGGLNQGLTYVALNDKPLIATARDKVNYRTLTQKLRHLHMGEMPVDNRNYGNTSSAFESLCNMENRKQHLRQTCDAQMWSNPSILESNITYRYLLVDEEHQIIYCFIPKVACTTFKLMMVFLAMGNSFQKLVNNPNQSRKYWHNPSNLRKVGIHTLDTYNMTQIKHMLDTYFTFLVVRHPLDRLYSVYTEQFVNPKPTNSYIDRIKSYFNTDDPSLTFDHFLHLVDTQSTGHGWFTNIHWTPYDELCHPCDINYDAILRLETLESDVKVFLDKLPQDEDKFKAVPKLNSMRDVNRDKLAELTDNYAGIDPSVVIRLMSIYKTDFELFGYDWDVDAVKASCAIKGKGTTTYMLLTLVIHV